MSIYAEVKHLGRYVDQTVTVRGWISTIRAHGKVAFAVVRDGTGIVQCVLVKKEVPEEVWNRFAELALEASVAVTGNVRADDRAPGGYELTLSDLQIIGKSE